jgi:hypothetical protein
MVAPFLLIVAAAAHQPPKVRTLFSLADYPEDAVLLGEEGNVFVRLGRAPDVTMNPAFDITINHGPPGVHLPLKINISYFVTPTGAITRCRQSETDGPPELVDVACKVSALAETAMGGRAVAAKTVGTL